MAAESWRRMAADNLEEVCRIGSVCHANLPEFSAFVVEKPRLSPESCLVLEHGGKVIVYLLAHPRIKGSTPALNIFLKRIPADAGVLYVHDIALLPAARGRGNAARGIARVMQRAVVDGYRTMGLIAIEGYAFFWRKHGFKASGGQPAVTEQLATYSNGALYMTREVF